MKLRRLLSCILALLLASSLPLTAFAETYDLEKGSISVTANAEGQYVSQEANDIKNHLETTTTVITQTILLQKKPGGGAGIGGGANGTGSNISVSGDAVVTATGRNNKDKIIADQLSEMMKGGRGYVGEKQVPERSLAL